MPSTTEAIETLRANPSPADLLGGFGPLVIALALLLAMMILVPSVAPEQIVEQRVDTSTSTPDPGAGG